jgi:glucose/arabinose dehydrogenase
LALAAAFSAATAAPAPAAPPVGDGQGGFELTEVGSFDRPIHADNAPGTGDALYVVESRGRVRVVKGGATLAKPFLDISDLVQCCGEEGLFSIAFHPRYKRNRLFYVYFTDTDGDERLMEFERKPKKRFVAMRASGRTVLRIPHPDHTNHNGGTIAFGPDRLLYVGPGDGGGGGDPDDNAQDRQSLLGKILRIDPTRTCSAFVKKGKCASFYPKSKRGRKGGKRGKKTKRSGRYGVPKGNPFFKGGGRPEIYSIGLRNPFRFSFDALTGALAIGDVGQGCREEIDFRSRGEGRGANFGWPGYEGTRIFDADRIVPGMVGPILEYDNSNAGPECAAGTAFQGVAVIAGFVVRDERLTAQYGRLLYSDAGNSQIRSVVASQRGGAGDRYTGLSVPGGIFSFAEGSGRRLFAISGDGPVYRLDPA